MFNRKNHCHFFSYLLIYNLNSTRKCYKLCWRTKHCVHVFHSLLHQLHKTIKLPDVSRPSINFFIWNWSHECKLFVIQNQAFIIEPYYQLWYVSIVYQHLDRSITIYFACNRMRWSIYLYKLSFIRLLVKCLLYTPGQPQVKAYGMVVWLLNLKLRPNWSIEFK